VLWSRAHLWHRDRETERERHMWSGLGGERVCVWYSLRPLVLLSSRPGGFLLIPPRAWRHIHHLRRIACGAYGKGIRNGFEKTIWLPLFVWELLISKGLPRRWHFRKELAFFLSSPPPPPMWAHAQSEMANSKPEAHEEDEDLKYEWTGPSFMTLSKGQLIYIFSSVRKYGKLKKPM